MAVTTRPKSRLRSIIKLHTRIILVAVIAVLLASSCAGTPTDIEPTQTISPLATIEVEFSEPESHIENWPTERWRTSAPEEQGMDSGTLAEMLVLIREQDYDIDSLVITRNGYVILDVKKHPFGKIPNEKHQIYSCTKSVISILIGIAIDKGLIESVDQSVLDFFPGKVIKNLDEDKTAMTLENLLTMTTGLDCRDSYLYQFVGLSQMEYSEDWVKHVLDLPMVAEPGSRFEYCNGASFLLSAIIQETSGMNAYEFANQHLFTPLGISHISWSGNPQGIALGYSGLQMLPRDMAKIGYLILKEGIWDGEEIVSPEWIKQSTRKHISGTLQEGYGYQWWLDASGIIMGLGYEGQYIIIEPELDLVVVFVSTLAEENFYLPEELLQNYIIPAAISSEPLPKNPEGEALIYSLGFNLSRP
jgi:CubicO group peptidase (beta-lactamase class C family)